MLLLQPEQPLRLDAEGTDVELAARFEKAVPHVLTVIRGEVDLPAGFAHEADPYQETGDPGHVRLGAAHVGERLRAQVAVRQLAHEIARLRSRDIDGREPARDVGDVDTPARPHCPPFEPLVDELDIAGRRGDERRLRA